MPPKGERINTSMERDALTNNPFAALSGGGPLDARSSEPQPDTTVAPRFRVARTRNGGWPLRLEKRAGGKVATIVERIEGDAGALLSVLKKNLATGGHAKADTLELQGDHRQAVTAYLDETARR
ncbi:MAG: hypothetical protein RLZZ303_3488 [Candidatus Hydrogenedentota bacterium]|jgi:translation initiation factor 1 (eIF-1/SUI1)